ncbi:MAG: zinc ribbon domain-containing protein, partial [Armatimonadota bacterium]
GQITLTPTTVCIPFKFPDKPTYVPATVIGVDSNENSLDYFVAFKGELGSFETAKIAFINRDHDKRARRGTKGKRNPKARLKIQRKHGRLRREKTRSLWNAFALLLINLAMENLAALVLEDLKGMKPKISLRQASKRMRQRLLNYWSIMSFHRILEVKCKEHGVPLVFINPAGTSRSCPKCGESLRGQDKECPTCGLSRHFVAAINIACRGIERFPSLSWLGQGFVGDPCSLSSGGKVRGLWCAVTTGNYAVEKSTA